MKKNLKSLITPIFIEYVVFLQHSYLFKINGHFYQFFVSLNNNFKLLINVINYALMKIFKYIPKKISFYIAGVVVLNLLSSCGIWDPADARKIPANVNDRVEKNLEEGRGFSIAKTMQGGGSTTYQFASSNPMWRATLEILDFLPLANVDYSGGIITTDWYNEGTASDESIKITIRFLTNEIRSDGIRIIVHKKRCNVQQKCTVKKISSTLEHEIRVAILKQAVLFEKEFKKNKKKIKR